MKVLWKKIGLAALPFALIAAVVALAAWFPRGEKEETGAPRVVRVWNVDTFEGGKGSRTAFLRNAARRTERGREGVYYLVSAYTVEGANAALAAGETPDMLSFGIGLDAFMERSLPLPYSFSGGEADGKCLAYPWCRGQYSLFSLTDDFQAEGRTAISSGGSNLSAVAAALSGVEGEPTESIAAYTGFLNGKYRYLFGTQRDACRFRARGVTVYERPAEQYCDLYQYISVLSAERMEDCLALLSELLSERTREMLGEIGMLPPLEGETGYTPSVFADAESRARLAEMAADGDGRKNLDKFLKTI